MESSIFDAIGIDPGIIIIFVLGVLLIVLIYMICLLYTSDAADE